MASSAFRGPPPPQTPEQQQPHLQLHHHWSPHAASVPPSPHSIDSLARQLYRTQLEAASSPTAVAAPVPSHGSAPYTPGSPGKDKPLPALPPARTPSQLSHQRQNQYPYSPSGRMRVASSPLTSIPAGNVAGPSRLPDHGHADARWDARQVSHPHFWLPNVASVAAFPQPRPHPSPLPLAQPSALAPVQPPTERLPAMPTLASPADLRAPPRRPLPAPPLMPVAVSTQVSSSSQLPLGEKAQLLAKQQQPTAAIRQPLPPSYETLFGDSLPSISGTDTPPTRPDSSTAVPPAASTSVRPLAPRSASTPVTRKPPAPATSSTSKRKPVPTLGTPTAPASPAAVKKGFSISADIPPASGQCWGIKRDGGRCTRAVGQSSRPVKSGGAGRTRHSSVSPTKSPAAGTRQQQQQQRQGQRQKSAPPGATLRSSPPKRDQQQGQGKRGRPIVIRDDSDPEFEVSTSSDESSISITLSSKSSEEDDEDDTPDEDGPLPLYCHQHAKEINKTQGFHTTSSPCRYIPFSDYIPPTASDLTAARMRTAMVEPLSEADLAEEGYIYIYEILEKQAIGSTGGTHSSARAAMSTTSSRTHTSLKVGRSVNPMARMAQWRSQCSSREAHLRALLPLLDPAMSQRVNAPVGAGATSGSGMGMGRQGLLVGADRVLTRGIVGSHRWEKLVHLELRERCASPSALAAAETAHKCSDCGKRHREIFAVPAELGFEGVKEVVLRWERFVRELR